AEVPLEDLSHESFWQQMLRWLVDGVPDAVAATLDRERVEPGSPLVVTASVSDSTYIEVNDASVIARITTPTGAIQEIPLEWTVERDGEYRVELRPSELGDYEMEIVARRGEEVLGSDVTYFSTGPSDEEFFGAGRRTALLERI